MPSTRLLLGLLLAACATVVCAEDKTVPLRARLQTAAAESSLDTPGLAPWHLKLEVQLFDDKGSPVDRGTVETWWLNPTNVQTTYNFPTYKATELTSQSGIRRTKGAGLPPDAVSVLFHQFIHPMPKQADIDQATPDLRKQNFGKLQLDCIMLDQPLVANPFPPIGLFPTFCFDPGKESLRLSFDFGSELVIRNSIGTFLGRNVATSVTVNENRVDAATAHVATLESRANLSAPSIDEANLEAPPAKLPLVGSAVMAGMLLSRPNPVYPQSAKHRHVSGTVILRAIIGRDGHIRSIRLVKVPDADLAIAAVDAVRRWVYKPYLLNGEPTEVDTTITVNFTLGPA